MSLIDKSEITPFRVVLGIVILSALVFGSIWVGGGFDKAPPHQVEVRFAGPLGTSYRVQGGPEADTGPVSIEVPYKFTTAADVDDLRLLVTVTPPTGPPSDEGHRCTVLFDDRAIAVSRAVPGSVDRICQTG